MNQEFSEKLAELLVGADWQVSIEIESGRRSLRLLSKRPDQSVDTGEIIYIRRGPDDTIILTNGYVQFTLPPDATPADVFLAVQRNEISLRFETNTNVTHRRSVLKRVLNAFPQPLKYRSREDEWPAAWVEGEGWSAIVNVRRNAVQVDLTFTTARIPKNLFR